MTLPASADVSPASRLGPVITIGVLFFIFGFVTWLNGPLITFVKLAFDLDDVNAFLVPMAFYLSYFFLALPSSAETSRRSRPGRGKSRAISCNDRVQYFRP